MMDINQQTPRPTAREHQTPGLCVTRRPVTRSWLEPGEWLTAPFQAERFEFYSIKKDETRGKGPTYTLLRVKIEGKPALILGLVDILSSLKFRLACLYHWYCVPRLPYETRRQVLNRWLGGVSRTRRIGYTGRTSGWRLIDGIRALEQQIEAARPRLAIVSAMRDLATPTFADRRPGIPGCIL